MPHPPQSQSLPASARESAELRDDLETRKVVDRAKGRLMQQGKTEEEAYRTIQDLARPRRKI